MRDLIPIRQFRAFSPFLVVLRKVGRKRFEHDLIGIQQNDNVIVVRVAAVLALLVAQGVLHPMLRPKGFVEVLVRIFSAVGVRKIGRQVQVEIAVIRHDFDLIRVVVLHDLGVVLVASRGNPRPVFNVGSTVCGRATDDAGN